MRKWGNRWNCESTHQAFPLCQQNHKKNFSENLDSKTNFIFFRESDIKSDHFSAWSIRKLNGMMHSVFKCLLKSYVSTRVAHTKFLRGGLVARKASSESFEIFFLHFTLDKDDLPPRFTLWSILVWTDYMNALNMCNGDIAEFIVWTKCNVNVIPIVVIFFVFYFVYFLFVVCGFYS